MKVNITTASFSESSVCKIVSQDTSHDVVISSYDDMTYPSRITALSPRTKGKIPKMLNWKFVDADYYIWVDSKFNITNPKFVDWMIDKIGDCDIGLFKHYVRSSIRDELDYMMNEMKKGNHYLLSRYIGEPMTEQVNFYLNDESFKDNKLFACGIFIYKKQLVNRPCNIMNDWLTENIIWSVQDQLSLPYLLHKHNTNLKIFDDHILYNNFVEYN